MVFIIVCCERFYIHLNSESVHPSKNDKPNDDAEEKRKEKRSEWNTMQITSLWHSSESTPVSWRFQTISIFYSFGRAITNFFFFSSPVPSYHPARLSAFYRTSHFIYISIYLSYHFLCGCSFVLRQHSIYYFESLRIKLGIMRA